MAMLVVAACADGTSSNNVAGPGPDGRESSVPAEAAQETPGLAYETKVTGSAPGDLLDLLTRSSTLVALQDKRPFSFARLEARAANDEDRFRRVLRSEGYYAASLDRKITKNAEDYLVEFVVTAGPRYTVSQNTVDYPPGTDSGRGLPGDLGDLGLRIESPARSADVIAAERRLVQILQNRGHPFAKVTDRTATVDHATRRMAVVLSVDPGPAATFGEVAFSGATSVEPGYLRRFVTLKPGAPYDRRELEKLASRLRGTGLFESVSVQNAGKIGPDGRLAIDVVVMERKHRSLGISGDYATDVGVSATTFWEHRNLLGRGEEIRVSLTAGEIRQDATIEAKRPNFGRLDQEVVSETQLRRQTTDAFDEIAASQILRLERRIDDRWRAGAGGAFEISEVEEAFETRQLALIGVPMFVARDSRDSVLEPTRGGRIRLDLTPTRLLIDENATFARAELLGTKYLKLKRDGTVILAGRGKFASVFGADSEEIPASRLFFAGGGGSIRGYEFQKAGDLDGDGDPFGGRSLIEASLELRVRPFESFGMVGFVDAGNAYGTTLPTFSTPPIRVGAGGGVRYFTPAGPIRFDIAFPVNGREDVDDDFQIYLGFGQAF